MESTLVTYTPVFASGSEPPAQPETKKLELLSQEPAPTRVELQPCPFCGDPSPVEQPLAMRFAYIECSQCGAHGPMKWGSEAASGAWNQRNNPRG